MNSGPHSSFDLSWIRPVRSCARADWAWAAWPGEPTWERMAQIGCPPPEPPTFWEWFPRHLPWLGVGEGEGPPRFWLWGYPKGLAAQAALDVLDFFGRDRSILTPLSRQRLTELPRATAVAVLYTPD
ncbi:MAG: hypothetical protein K6U87_05895 [Firmicutes bacterium]|nr:hypothetical protein [Bacillota bacterium]